MGEGVADDFAGYLTRALRLLLTEAPVHFAATRARLGPLSIGIGVGDDAPIRVRLDRAEGWVERDGRGEGSGADVSVRVARADLAGFLRGEFTIEEGLEAGRLAVRGPLAHVLAFLEALAAWLHGALRSPSFPSLHQQYLATLN